MSTRLYEIDFATFIYHQTLKTLPPFLMMTQEPHSKLDRISSNANLHMSILQAAGIAVNPMGDIASLSPLPYISTAVDQLVKIVGASQVVNDTKGQFKQLCQDVASLLAALCQSRAARKGTDELWPTAELEGDVKEITDLIQELDTFTEKKTSKNIWSRTVSLSVDPGEVVEYRQKVKECLDKFKLRSHININSKLIEMISLNTAANVKARQEAFVIKRKGVMRKLAAHMAPGARYDSSARQDVPRCLPNTSEVVFDKVTKWLEDAESPRHILWVHSRAGVGKTTLAQFIAEQYHESGALGASFFWSKVAPNRPTTNTGFVASVAYQLCQSNIDKFTERVVEAVDTDPGIFDQTLEVQINRLVIEPLLYAFPTSSALFDCLQYLLLVIDGLNECEGADSRKQVLDILLAAVQQQSLPLRVLVFSRYEHDIRAVLEFDPQCSELVDSYPLETDFDRLKQDVRTYINSEFHNIKHVHPDKHNILPDWPSPGDVDVLVERSAGVFIYASIVMRHIGSCNGEPMALLREMIDLTPIQSTAFTSLDAIYLYILHKISQETEKVRDILHWMLADTVDDMDKTVSLSASLLGLEEGDIYAVLKPLSAVIHMPDHSDPHFPLQFFHTSFGDFLKDKARVGGPADSFWFDPPVAHTIIAKKWIRYYSKQVKDQENIDSLGWTLSAIVYHCKLSRKPGSNCLNDESLLTALENMCLNVNLVDVGTMDPKHIWKWIDPALNFLVLLRESDALPKLYHIHEASVNTSLNTYWRQLSVKSREHIPLILLACTHKDLTAADSLTRFAPIKDRRKEDVYKPTLLCLNMLLQSSAHPSRDIGLLYRLLTNEHWPPVVSATQYSQLSLYLVKDLLYRRRLNSEPESGLIFFRSQLPGIIVKVLARASVDVENAELVTLTKEKILLSTGDHWEDLRQACEIYITKYEQSLSEYTSGAQLDALHSTTSNLTSTRLLDAEDITKIKVSTTPADKQSAIAGSVLSPTPPTSDILNRGIEMAPVSLSTYEWEKKNMHLHTPPDIISESAPQSLFQWRADAIPVPKSMSFKNNSESSIGPSSTSRSTLVSEKDDLKFGGSASPIVIETKTLSGISAPASSQSTLDIETPTRLSTMFGMNREAVTSARVFGPLFKFGQDNKHLEAPETERGNVAEPNKLGLSILGMEVTNCVPQSTMSNTDAHTVSVSSDSKHVEANQHAALSKEIVDNLPKRKLAGETFASRDSTVRVALRSIRGSFAHLTTRVAASFGWKKKHNQIV